MSASQNAIRKIQNLIENDPSIKDADILEIKSGNQWINEAKRKPIPNRLFDSFWYENEICILYADTNNGKSILILAHTSKRKQFSELSKNDLAGSGPLMNFCDSCFAIGSSALDPRYRYLKQIKQRNTECIYDSLNVAVCEIESVNSLLSFILIRLEPEFNHLKQVNAESHEERDTTIKELKSQGLTNTEIAKQFGVSEGTIRNRLKQLS